MFRSAFPPDLCAKMTLFQFFEGVTDQQAFQTFGCHPGWQEAISITAEAVDFMPHYLCQFRAEFHNDQRAGDALENAQHLLSQTGILPTNAQKICATQIVNTVCLINHLGDLLVAMNEALEALAATHPEWLQQTMLPHWIERYPWRNCSGLPVSLPEQMAFASAVAEDVLYLLEQFGTEMKQKRPLLSQATLTWADNATNETGFIIERTDANGTVFLQIGSAAANVTTYVDNTLEPKMTYTYRVYAINDGGPSGTSNEAIVVTPGEPPQAPTRLSPRGVAQTTVNMHWTDNATNEEGFYVERSLDGVTFEVIATVGPNVVSYLDSGLTASTTYYYRVQAFNVDGASAYTQVLMVTTRGTTRR